MKSRILMRLIAVGVLTILSFSGNLAAQEVAAPRKKAEHHHYKFIDLGTLGGPQSYGDAGHGAANINNHGIAVGVADTNIPDPFTRITILYSAG